MMWTRPLEHVAQVRICVRHFSVSVSTCLLCVAAIRLLGNDGDNLRVLACCGQSFPRGFSASCATSSKRRVHFMLSSRTCFNHCTYLSVVRTSVVSEGEGRKQEHSEQSESSEESKTNDAMESGVRAECITTHPATPGLDAWR